MSSPDGLDRIRISALKKIMKPTFGSAYLDDNLTQFTTIHCILFMLSTEAMISTGHYLKRVVINIRASKNISGLVKVSVTSPAGLISESTSQLSIVEGSECPVKATG